MNSYRKIIPISLLAIFCLLQVKTLASSDEEVSQDSEKVELVDREAENIALISEAFGHLIAKHIESTGVNFDLASIVRGLQDSGAGKSAPMSEIECIQAIAKSKEAAFEAQSKANLEKADSFMASNLKEAGIIALEPNKLHYRIDTPGNGEAVTEGNSPAIRYTGKFLDGSVFGASLQDRDIVSLDETIPGFGKGLLGMKEGEKRTLYIHPDLAYGKTGRLPPNSLLVFEIEMLKAHAKEEIAAAEELPDNLEVSAE